MFLWFLYYFFFYAYALKARVAPATLLSVLRFGLEIAQILNSSPFESECFSSFQIWVDRNISYI